MARFTLFAFCVVGLVVTVASPASAQCATFSATASCSAPQTSPLRAIDFGVTQRIVPPTRYKAVPIVPTMPALPVGDADAIDCKMAKPVDPSFTSHMPIGRPDPNVRFSAKTLSIPACRP